MSYITFHTGSTGDELTINIEWFDHNNTIHRNDVVIRILDQDKPRTLQVLFDGVTLARVAAENTGRQPIETRKEPIVPAEWQYHEMQRHGAQPVIDIFHDAEHNDFPVDDAVAAWNRRRVAQPDAPWPYDVQLFPKPGAIYPGVGYVDAGMA